MFRELLAHLIPPLLLCHLSGTSLGCLALALRELCCQTQQQNTKTSRPFLRKQQWGSTSTPLRECKTLSYGSSTCCKEIRWNPQGQASMRSSFSMELTPNMLTAFAETTLTGGYVEQMELHLEKGVTLPGMLSTHTATPASQEQGPCLFVVCWWETTLRENPAM